MCVLSGDLAGKKLVRVLVCEYAARGWCVLELFVMALGGDESIACVWYGSWVVTVQGRVSHRQGPVCECKSNAIAEGQFARFGSAWPGFRRGGAGMATGLCCFREFCRVSLSRVSWSLMLSCVRGTRTHTQTPYGGCRRTKY